MSRHTRGPFKSRLLFGYGILTLYDAAFLLASPKQTISHSPGDPKLAPNGPSTPYMQRLGPWHIYGLGSSAFARRYLRNLFEFFSSAYLDVSVRPVPFTSPIYSGKDDAITCAGFLHSGTSGSTLLCSSPERFVAYTPFIGL